MEVNVIFVGKAPFDGGWRPTEVRREHPRFVPVLRGSRVASSGRGIRWREGWCGWSQWKASHRTCVIRERIRRHDSWSKPERPRFDLGPSQSSVGGDMTSTRWRDSHPRSVTARCWSPL